MRTYFKVLNTFYLLFPWASADVDERPLVHHIHLLVAIWGGHGERHNENELTAPARRISLNKTDLVELALETSRNVVYYYFAMLLNENEGCETESAGFGMLKNVS